MINLIFDTETTGFPLNAPVEDPRQPYLVQLAVLLAKEDDQLIHKWDCIIRCPVDIPEDASNIHGITTARSRAEGIDNAEAIGNFRNLLSGADRAVCHNAAFDFKIMRFAYHRAGFDYSELDKIKRVCTMKTTTPMLKLPGKWRGSFKWPKLQEAYKALVNEEGFGGAHSADADTMACWKVLRELERRGVELL